jgi:hypothetical protein
MGKAREFLAGLKAGFGDFGAGVANVVNFILLSFVYVAGVGMTSVVAKMRGKHFLKAGVDPKAKSYFEHEAIKKEEKDRYYSQF